MTEQRLSTTPISKANVKLDTSISNIWLMPILVKIVTIAICLNDGDDMYDMMMMFK